MLDIFINFANWYIVALLSFLIYIRKGFLQISGDYTLPSLDINYSEEQALIDAEDEILKQQK